MVELKFVQYSQGDYILCMTSRYFFRSFTNVRLLVMDMYCFKRNMAGATSGAGTAYLPRCDAL
jgi:hypothetical protein